MKYLYIAFIVALIFSFSCRKKNQYEESLCPSHLRSLGAVLAMYSEVMNNALPPKISILPANEYVLPSFLGCPDKDLEAKPANYDEFDKWIGYYYVYYPDWKKLPKDYPVLYDKRLSNHNSKGIFILNIEKIRQPKTAVPGPFWDEGAQWLKKFAKDHPDLNISMPEDLKTK